METQTSNGNLFTLHSPAHSETSFSPLNSLTGKYTACGTCMQEADFKFIYIYVSGKSGLVGAVQEPGKCFVNSVTDAEVGVLKLNVSLVGCCLKRF